MSASMKLSLILGISLCVLGHLSAVHGSDLAAKYSWKPMKIGGGGWVVGMNIPLSEKGLMYARTDVSGAYRWDPAAFTWKRIVTADSMPAEYVKYGKYRGADSLVGAPADPEIAYMAYEGEIFRSTDRGDKWIPTGFASRKVKMEPNGEGRQDGERLGVDPHNSNVIYYASIADGLWTSEDGGTNWGKVQAVPAGAPPHGVNTVVFDKSSGTLAAVAGAAKTKVVYVTVDQKGIFKSSDAGATWTNIAATGPGISSKMRDAETGPDGTYYVVCDNENGAAGSVWKCSSGGTWQNITPGGEQGGSQPYWEVAVDPADAKHVVVLRSGGRGFVSKDQGATWANRTFHLNSPDISWLGKQENYWLSVGEIAFDSDGKLWFAEGFGVWEADDLESPAIEWRSASKGIEETCGNDIIAPPGGKPLAAMWDAGVFRFDDPDTYTARRALPYFMSAWALDWCASEPSFIAAVFRNHLGFPPHVNEAGYSTDGGLTWKVFPAVEKKEIPSGLEYGVVAVSANSPDKIVWVPANGAPPYYTSDRGAAWNVSSVVGLEGSSTGLPYSPRKPLCADRVLPDTFYLYHMNGGVYRSDDGGATFSPAGKVVSDRYNAILKAAPGLGEDLWFAEGSQENPVGGLWRSRDGGKTWTAIPGIDQAFNFGFGKSAREGEYPAVYVAGVVQGETGIYRSIDEGTTWDRIGIWPLGIFDWIDAMDGDKDTFGKVYIGFTSSGFAYGAEEN